MCREALSCSLALLRGVGVNSYSFKTKQQQQQNNNDLDVHNIFLAFSPPLFHSNPVFWMLLH